MPKCPSCSKEVYFTEKVTTQGKDWHSGCLKCAGCNAHLVSQLFVERNDTPYCQQCFKERFGGSAGEEMKSQSNK